MGRVEEAFGEADAPDELDELVVGVGDRGASYGGAVEQVEPDRFRTGRVQVDHVGPLEVGLEATESEEQVEGGLLEGRFLFGVRRRDASANQVVGVAFQSVVDEFGAKGLLVGTSEPGLVLPFPVGLCVGKGTGHLGAQLAYQAGVYWVIVAPGGVRIGGVRGQGHRGLPGIEPG
jgi:hypothetical protein